MQTTFEEIKSMEVYLQTSTESMLSLDAQRHQAEMDCASGDVWFELARQYERQGRPAVAASCRRRAEHYAQIQALVVE